MKRENLRKLVRETGPPHKMVVTAPVTDAEALRTLLFDVCGECEGGGLVDGDSYRSPEDRSLLPYRCPACGGSGRVPKDGVEPFGYLDDTTGHHTTYWMIPVSMLDPEGDTDV